jgi:hypothetical protein
LAAFPSARQKDLVLELLAQVLTLKQAGQQTGTLSHTATELAIVFGSDLAAQIPLVCSETDCEEESYLLCPVCEEPFFSLSEGEAGLRLACRKRASHWQAALPTEVALECGHSAVLDAVSLRDELELLPDAQLLSVMAQLVNTHLSGYQFDPLKEGFYVQGSTLHYYADKDDWLAVLPKDGGKGIHVNRTVMNIKENYGQAIGVVDAT